MSSTVSDEEDAKFKLNVLSEKSRLVTLFINNSWCIGT